MNGMLLSLYFVAGMLVLLTMLGLWVAAVMPGLDRWSRHFFIAFFSILMLCLILYSVEMLAYDKPELLTLQKLIVFLEYLFTPVLLPLLTVYLLHCCGEEYRNSALLYTELALWGVFFVLLVIAQFKEGFYTIQPEFSCGPLHPLLMAPVVITLLITLEGTVRRRARLSPKHFRALLVFLIPLTISMIVSAFVFIPLITDISISILALTMFIIILSDEVEQSLRQEREIARQHASIMALQMRPHFIYNTMTSIYYLCKQDADLAQQVTLDFTTYLRKNFTAIASEEPIPFAEELAHTRAYLSVEQAQFEDFLFVDYDTPHVDFRVPPLTLQPIVENAVKHGMDPDAASFHISIRTMKTEDMSVIVVENDGADFDALGTGAADDSEPHIALKNIRQRLEMMCRGKMTISPREGGGTIVKVEIP